MEFTHNIDEISVIHKIRKDCVKRYIKNNGFQKGEDYIINVPKITNGSGGQNKEIILLSDSCFKQIDTWFAMRKRDLTNPKTIEIKYITRFVPKETEIINFIYDALSSTCTLKKQYKVNKYRVDLYIVDVRVCIECDEHNHDDRDKVYEHDRQSCIEKELSCKFIRFDPDDKDFNLARLISDILKCLQNNHLLKQK